MLSSPTPPRPDPDPCISIGRVNQLIAAVAVVGHSIVTLNCEKDKVSVYIYDFIKGDWREGAPMPGLGEGRTEFAYASDGVRYVFVAGGYHGNVPLQSALSYDVEKDKWEALPDMAIKKGYAQGCFHAGKFYVTDPWAHKLPNAQSWIYFFDVSTSAWSTVSGMTRAGCPQAKHKNLFTIGSDGKMY